MAAAGRGSDGERRLLLAVEAMELDAEVFALRVHEGRAALDGGDPERARELLSSGLGLWRGPPLAEVAFEDFAQPEIQRLEELHSMRLRPASTPTSSSEPRPGSLASSVHCSPSIPAANDWLPS